MRLLLLLPVLAAAASTRAVAWIMPIGGAAASVLALPWKGRSRHPVSIAGEGRGGPRGRTAIGPYLAITFTTNGAAQVLLAGGPLLLVALGAEAAAVSVFFVTTTAARIPLVLAYGGLLSRLLPVLRAVARSGSIRRIHRVGDTALAVTLVLAAVGGALGALLGPPLVALFFGASFAPGGGLAAGAAAGVTLACGAMFLNQFLLASGDERRTVAPWLVALGGAGIAVAASAGWTPTSRVITGLVVGELAAVAFLWVALRRAARAASHDGRWQGRTNRRDVDDHV